MPRIPPPSQVSSFFVGLGTNLSRKVLAGMVPPGSAMGARTPAVDGSITSFRRGNSRNFDAHQRKCQNLNPFGTALRARFSSVYLRLMWPDAPNLLAILANGTV